MKSSPREIEAISFIAPTVIAYGLLPGEVMVPYRS